MIPSQQFSIHVLEISSVSSRSYLSKHRVVAFHRCLSILVGMQTAFPKDFTADKYDVIDDCSGTTWAVNHTSISGAFGDPGGPLLAGIQPLATSFPQGPTFPGRGGDSSSMT